MKRAVLILSLIHIWRCNRELPDSKIIFAHPFVSNPEAQITKNALPKEQDVYKRQVMMSMILSSYLTDKSLGIALIQPLILPPARAAVMGANTTSPIGMYRDFLQQLDDLKTPSRIAVADNQFYANYIAKLVDGKIVLENGSVFLPVSYTHLPPEMIG